MKKMVKVLCSKRNFKVYQWFGKVLRIQHIFGIFFLKGIYFNIFSIKYMNAIFIAVSFKCHLTFECLKTFNRCYAANKALKQMFSPSKIYFPNMFYILRFYQIIWIIFIFFFITSTIKCVLLQLFVIFYFYYSLRFYLFAIFSSISYTF